MARFSRLEVLLKMKESGMVPIFYNKDVEVSKKVIQACYEGGARIFEFTNRGDFATLAFAELNKWAAKEYPDLIMGIGSVIDKSTTAMYIALGANFIVSPILDEGMAKVCNQRKVVWEPGCGTVTEISKAHELGAEIVKMFPASELGGPGFIKAVLGPLPWTSILVTGGVKPTEENLKAWFDAGATCVGMGSNLFPPEMIKAGNWSGISKLCNNTLKIIAKIKYGDK